MTAIPAFFLSHGSPMFALEPGELGSRLGRIGQGLSGSRAILVVSAHWQTNGLCITATQAPDTIHDFGGFPDALRELRYPAPGAPLVARETRDILALAGYDAELDYRRGLDHGAWVPLMHMFPKADVPVFQVSLPIDTDTRGAFRLGQALAALRERGVMIIGSGSLTHNLHEVFRGTNDTTYARQFADWVHAAVHAGDSRLLIEYRKQAPHAERAHPTEEHYLPLLVAMGAARRDECAQRIRGGMTDGVLSMDSFAWGLQCVG